jgi:hypothetical protein
MSKVWSAARTRRTMITRCVVIALVFPLLPGCPQPVDDSTDGGFVDKEGNFSFGSATPIELPENGSFTFSGEIDGTNDVDVFSLGAFAPGDRIRIDVRTTSGDLDPVASLFDADENVHSFSDDRTPDGSNLNPLIETILRGRAGEYYLGIVAFPDSRTAGRYSVTVEVERGIGVPATSPQVVYLNWAGGRDVVIPHVGVYDLPVFDAADLGLQFSGQTAFIKDRVEEVIAQRYAGFGLVLVSSDDFAEPSAAHSVVHFGGFDARAFGVSEQVDDLNADQTDVAIVFIDSFRGAFASDPTPEQMALAIGNTAAHEIGHLLGLVHTKDCFDLMDATCSNSSLLQEQELGRAELADAVFPIGFQDALQVVGWTLGLVGL